MPQPVDANAENFLEESRQQVHHTQVESRHSVECNHPGDHLNNDLDVKDRHCNAARYMQNAVRRSEPLSSLNDSDIVSEDVGQNTIPTKPKKCKKQDKEHTVSSLIVAEGIEENIFRSKKHKRCQTDIPVVSQTPLVITESISDIEDSKTTKKPKRSRRHKRVSNVSVNVECVQESTPKVVSPLKTSVQSSSSGSRHLRFDDQYIGTCDLEGNKMEEIAVRDREFNVKCLTPNHQDSSTNNHLTHLENCQNGASEVDYTKYPQLKCQPRVNDVIAYKVNL